MTAPSSQADALRAARKLIEVPGRWIRGTYARVNKTGQATRATSPDAKCWCALGALRAANCDDTDSSEERYYLEQALPVGHYYVHRMNDDPRTKHKDILSLFDRAIALADAAP